MNNQVVVEKNGDFKVLPVIEAECKKIKTLYYLSKDENFFETEIIGESIILYLFSSKEVAELALYNRNDSDKLNIFTITSYMLRKLLSENCFVFLDCHPEIDRKTVVDRIVALKNL